MNKRLIHIFIENFLINLFPLNSNQNVPAAFTNSGAKSSQIQAYIHNYLAKSSRVRPEFKQIFSTSLQNLNNSHKTIPIGGNNSNFNSSSTLPRSKSIQSYVQC